MTMAPLGVRARFRALLVGLLLAAGAGAGSGSQSMAQRLDDIRALVNGDYVPPGGPPRARGARATASPRCRRAPGREKEQVKT